MPRPSAPAAQSRAPAFGADHRKLFRTSPTLAQLLVPDGILDLVVSLGIDKVCHAATSGKALTLAVCVLN